MRRWYFRHASTLILAATLPLKLLAQPTPQTPPVPGNPPATPAPTPAPVPAPVQPVAPVHPAAPAQTPVTGIPVAPGVAGVPGLPPGVFLGVDAYRAATPYHATVVGRAAPNPAYNRHNFTIPCFNPNQNFAPLELVKPDCLGKAWGFFAHWTRYTGGNNGCGCGAAGGCDGFLPTGGNWGGPVAAKPTVDTGMTQVGFWPFSKDKTEVGVHGVGSCATCGNTKNFILGSSRSYFGESSREFFERPPAVDGIRHKWNMPPTIYRIHPYYAPPPARTIPPTVAAIQPQ